MYRKLLLTASLLLLLFMGPSAPAVDVPVAAGKALPSAAEWIPQDAVIVVELSQPRALLKPLLAEKVTDAVAALPLYKKQASKKGLKDVTNLVKLLESVADTDWRTGLQTLTGGGVTLAVCPKDTVLVFIDAEDAHMLRQVHGVLLNIARSEAEKQGKADRVKSAAYRGVTGWTFDGKEAHAIIGNRLVYSSRPQGLKAVVDLRAEGKGKSLSSLPAYRAAKQAVGPVGVGMAFANLEVLKHVPNVANVLKLDEANPLAALLLTGVTDAVRASSWLGLGLDLEKGTLVARAFVDGKIADPAGPAAFALPSEPGRSIRRNLTVPRRIAALSFHRDLYRFYAAKDALFPERTSGLIFFENMMGIFFSGRDLTDEVLSLTKPEIRFVVAEQEYDPAVGTPATRIPAFAAVLRLRDATEFDEMVEEAWQKAVGLVSFTRGQQALPGLIIDREVHGDTKFTYAYFSSADVEDKTNLDQRFNFRPALAMPSDYVILSSTEALARDLIDALKKEPADADKSLAGIHSLVEVDGGRLSSILNANRGALIRQNMVNEGNTQEEAETAIDVLIALAKSLGQVKLSVGAPAGRTQARLEVKPALP